MKFSENNVCKLLLIFSFQINTLELVCLLNLQISKTETRNEHLSHGLLIDIHCLKENIFLNIAVKK
jgi:hypothetical protein